MHYLPQENRRCSNPGTSLQAPFGQLLGIELGSEDKSARASIAHGMVKFGGANTDHAGCQCATVVLDLLGKAAGNENRYMRTAMLVVRLSQSSLIPAES